MGKLNLHSKTMDSNPSPGANLEGISGGYKSDQRGVGYEIMEQNNALPGGTHHRTSSYNFSSKALTQNKYETSKSSTRS
jgi:hypothetical protein